MDYILLLHTFRRSIAWRRAIWARALAAVGMASGVPRTVTAQDTLAYSFETGLEGFTANGTGITVTLDTIGATEGTGSMKVAMTGPTFVGAQTGMLHPAIGDPPGLDHVLFDLTLTEAFNPDGFAVVGVMIFGVSQTGAPLQLQTGPSLDPELEFHVDDLEPGTYRDVRIDMTQFTHPVTFEPGTFNDIIGTQGSGPNDMIPTGFQLYFNKTGGLANPLTVYIDNIRVGTTPAAVAGDYNENGTVDAADYAVWRDNVDTTNVLPNDPIGGTIGTAQYNQWKANFGLPGSGSASGSIALGAVPEPASGLLLAFVAACFWATNRKKAVR